MLALLQHGYNECLLNTVEACAIDAWPDVVIDSLHVILILLIHYPTYILLHLAEGS
jgi:hypothetical protein